jgi:glycosyltransferase involved in cell wall biosynthesis
MKILFLSHYFPPEINAPASRTYEHCREWVKAGHEVTVVTCAPNHPRGKVYDGYKNRIFQREQRDGIRIIRLWTFLSANEGFARRTANYVSYMFACILAIPFFPKADIVISTSPQFFNGLAGYFVSRAKRIPWVLEIRDLWPESIVAVGAIRSPRLIGGLRWLEEFAYRKADRIVPVTDAFAAYMRERGVPAGKIAVIKNGVELGLFRRDTSGDLMRTKYSLQSKTIAAYFGTHGMAHHLETILEAAQLTADDDRIIFLLVGDGAERARLLEMKDRLKLSNVLMLEQQPKEAMPELWAMADISLVLLRKTDLFKTVIPSKIFEAMGMAKPIILGVEGESRDLVEEAGGGLPVDPENAVELAAAVRRLADSPDEARSIGQRGFDFVCANFDRRVLAARYIEILSAAIAGSHCLKRQQHKSRRQ